MQKENKWKLFILRFMYVITILLVQTDVLTADDSVCRFHEGIHFTASTDRVNDEIEPDDDYTRTRILARPTIVILPILLTLIPNQYIISQKENYTPKPIDCIICNNSRQADLCIYRI